jgi:hypothetical protein
MLILAGTSVSHAQTGCTIKKAHAWYNVSMPGTIMTDENGNPVQPIPNITRFIYVEYSGTKAPEIKSVRYHNAALNFTVVKVKEKTVSIGDKNLNPDKTISVKKGNSFLKINVYPFEGKTMPDADCKSIVILSKAGGKNCKFYLSSEKAFATMPRY